MADPLPLYVQDQVPQDPFDALLIRISAPISTAYPNAHEILVAESQAPAYSGPEKSKSREPIDKYPLGSILKQQIVKELFSSIWREDTQAVALLIQHNLVTPNTTGQRGQTPLLEAILTKSIPMVKEVLRLGADCNKFGVVVSNHFLGYRRPIYSQVKLTRFDGFQGNTTRTPLMLAASMGSLAIVKLLFEPPYSADDTLVAPDGQIALRLAAENDHRAIVEYLPSRRAGGYLRFKTHHAGSLLRIKEALRQIFEFIKIFLWHVPKFFVWSVPKHLVVLPVVRSCKWCWANKEKFGPWCKHQLIKIPKRVARFGKAAWKTAKKIPKAVWKAAKATPKAIWEFTKELWEVIKEIGKALWKLFTVRIPNAILTALKWTWAGIRSLAQALGDISLKILSFLHSVLEATITFLRNVTLRDVWNGFCDILRAIFVTLPRTLWSWIKTFGETSYRFMKALLGWFGVTLWWICVFLKEIIVYLPVRVGIILLSLGNSIAKVFSEITVWINPKA